MPRRIKRPAEYEETYHKLTESEEIYGVFNTMKDVFMLSASIGFKENKPELFQKIGGDIPWTVFKEEIDEPLINSIAIANTEDLTILMNDEETYDRKFKIIEEYANYGIKIIKNKIIDSPGDPIDNLVALIMECEDETKKQNTLSSFVDDLF
ncbi:DNA phosphorothioation-associated protein 4 [Priestia megaterium]